MYMYKVQMPDGTISEIRSVPDVDVSKAALKHWQARHGDFIFGYVSLGGLTAEDVLSVLSGAEQGIVKLGYDPEHRVNSFKLLSAAATG